MQADPVAGPVADTVASGSAARSRSSESAADNTVASPASRLILTACPTTPVANEVFTAPLALSFFAGAQRTSDQTVVAAAAVLVAMLIAVTFLVRGVIKRRLQW